MGKSQSKPMWKTIDMIGKEAIRRCEIGHRFTVREYVSMDKERSERIKSAIFDYDMAKACLKESQEILFYFAVEAGWNKEDKSDIRVARAYLEGLLNRSLE